MKSKVLVVIALILVLVSLSLFAYPNVSKEVVQKKTAAR